MPVNGGLCACFPLPFKTQILIVIISIECLFSNVVFPSFQLFNKQNMQHIGNTVNKDYLQLQFSFQIQLSPYFFCLINASSQTSWRDGETPVTDTLAMIAITQQLYSDFTQRFHGNIIELNIEYFLQFLHGFSCLFDPSDLF